MSYPQSQQVPPPVSLEKRTRSVLGTIIYVLLALFDLHEALTHLIKLLEAQTAHALSFPTLFRIIASVGYMTMALMMLWCCRTQATSGNYRMLGALLSLYSFCMLLYALLMPGPLSTILNAGFIILFIVCIALAIAAFSPQSKPTVLRPMSIIVESSPLTTNDHSNVYQELPPPYTQYSPQPATAYVYYGGQLGPAPSQQPQFSTYSAKPPAYTTFNR